MALERIHKLPSELPHARLYLDDIEEVSKTLLEAYAAPLAERHQEAKVTYTVGDLRMDSIDDLQTRGGSTTELRIALGDFYADVDFRSILNPQIGLYALDEQARWAVYAKIKSIFDKRQLRIKNAILSLPEKLKFALYGMVSVLPYLVFLTQRFPRGLWILFGWMIFVALLGFTLYRPSRVFFVRSHESSKVSSAARRGYVRDLIFLVLGAVVVKLTEQLFKYFFR